MLLVTTYSLCTWRKTRTFPVIIQSVNFADNELFTDLWGNIFLFKVNNKNRKMFAHVQSQQ